MPPGKPAAAAAPFVLLARDAQAEQSFATLADAVAAAASGDTIQVHGDGPFVINGLVLDNKVLTIRAAAGFRPVLRLSEESEKANLPLFSFTDRLTLEGLELQRLGKEPQEPGKPAADPRLVLADRGRLAAANCRFLMTPPRTGIAILAHESPGCDLRNCEVTVHPTRNSAWNRWFLSRSQGCFPAILPFWPALPGWFYLFMRTG